MAVMTSSAEDTIGRVVALAAGGDEAAFARIVQAHHADMTRVCFAICGDLDLADEAVQAAWPIAWRKLGTLHDPERLRPWLVAIAANEARQLLRHQRRRTLVEIARFRRSTPGTRSTPPRGPRTSTSPTPSRASRPTTGRCSPSGTSPASTRPSWDAPPAGPRRARGRALLDCSTVSDRSSLMTDIDRFEVPLRGLDPGTCGCRVATLRRGRHRTLHRHGGGAPAAMVGHPGRDGGPASDHEPR